MVALQVGPDPRAPRGEVRSADWLEIVIAVAAVTALIPLFLILLAILWVQDGGPPLFAHVRLGRGGRAFRCWKFRTMRVDAAQCLADHLARDAAAQVEWLTTQKLRADPRVTPIGALLRKTSLDELPQLFNVLLGEMSLVGPRPIVQSEVDRYGRYFPVYCSVRPGITGLWQVSGRSKVDYRRRVAMDVLYARRRSTGLNVKLLAQTIPAVLLRRGAY